MRKCQEGGRHNGRGPKRRAEGAAAGHARERMSCAWLTCADDDGGHADLNRERKREEKENEKKEEA